MILVTRYEHLIDTFSWDNVARRCFMLRIQKNSVQKYYHLMEKHNDCRKNEQQVHKIADKCLYKGFVYKKIKLLGPNC